MLYRVVDTYDLHNTVELQPGESYPARCLVEDPSGIRIMIVPDDSPIEAVHWEYAHGDGAQAILRAQPMSFVLTETFVEHREAQGVWHVFYLPEEYWTRCEKLLSYLEMADYVSTAPAGEETGFCHLHTHSEHSALDGLSTVREMVQAAVADGQRALAITDHGVCAAHPALQLACQQAGIKPIFGLEAYFVDNRHDRGDEHRNDYMHLVLLAMTEQGLLNLWALSTESYRTGQYYKPRIDWELLEKLGDGIIATTGCLRGPLLHPYLEGDGEEKALQNLSRLKSIFGDRLYIELHVNQLPQQIEGNKWLVEVSEKYDVPLVAVVDSHYTHEHERDLHRTWLSIQTNSDVQDDSSLFAGGQDYHMMTRAEVEKNLAYLGSEVVQEAVLNTGRVADRCTAEMTGKDHNPIYSKPTEEWPDPVAHDVDRLWDLCFERWAERTIGKANSQDEYMARLEREMTLLIDKRFCGYFLMEWDIVMYAKRNGVLVGPGRGSGGGSLVAYLIGITEIDPVEADLLFERFLTDGRTELPDFDIDFPSSKKKFMLDYVASRWGEDHVCTVGTHLRLKNKAVINDTSRAMKSLLAEDAFRDMRAVSAIIDEAEASTAGLGLSWDELWVQAGEVLEPYRQKYPQVFEIAAQLHGRLKTYGKHAAGVIIDPENPLTGALPLRRGEDEEGMISQFDMHALVSLGFVKFDMLNIRNLDTIQDAVDLIRVQTGREITPYTWRDEYRDPQIWGEISDGWTLGMFQIETVSGTRLTRRFRPASLAELSDVITLVRPGPMRSGLTEIYFRRRNGDEEVSYADARLEAILSKTYGTMLYQEDIMAVAMSLAGYDSNEADAVRKILGKKKVELVNEAGEKFVRRSVANGTDREVAEHLWEQMAEFAKYCVSGDTKIHLAASGSHSDGTVSVEELYRRLHSQLPAYENPGQSDGAVGRPKSTFSGPCVCCGEMADKYIRGYCQNKCNAWLLKFKTATKGLYALSYYADGKIRPARILDVVKQGEQRLWRITLADGRWIDATSNHRHLTPDGYRTVETLGVGGELVVDAGYQMPTAEEQARRGRLTVGERQREGVVNLQYGRDNYGFIDGGHSVWRKWRATNDRVCRQCGSTENVQQAHLDGNHQNNVETNYAWLCQPCHLSYDYAVNNRVRRWQKGHMSGAEKIISIDYIGVDETYDVVMDSPHNFVANGIVTHNSFGRAHAYAYAMLGFWTGWLKFHYPIQFLTAALSTVKQERVPEFVEEARRMGYNILPPDINESGEGFTSSPGRMAVRYGLKAVKGIGDAAVTAIIKNRPYTSWEDFQERKGSKCNSGHIKTLVHIGAMDSLFPNRRALEKLMEAEAVPGSDRCSWKDPATVSEWNGLPCTFDWASEPPPLGRTGKPAKPKPVPKRCTRACRQFAPTPLPDPAVIAPYTDADIRTIEMDTLGVYLSSTPFDRIPEEDRKEFATAADIMVGAHGTYMLAVVLKTVRQKPGGDRNGNAMGWLTLTTERGEIDCVVFHSTWAKHVKHFKAGTMAYVALNKNDRGQTLELFEPLDT